MATRAEPYVNGGRSRSPILFIGQLAPHATARQASRRYVRACAPLTLVCMAARLYQRDGHAPIETGNPRSNARAHAQGSLAPPELGHARDGCLPSAGERRVHSGPRSFPTLRCPGGIECPEDVADAVRGLFEHRPVPVPAAMAQGKARHHPASIGIELAHRRRNASLRCGVGQFSSLLLEFAQLPRRAVLEPLGESMPDRSIDSHTSIDEQFVTGHVPRSV
jgi:hypothetical protein